MHKFREKPKVIEAMLFDGTQAELMEVVAWVQRNGYIWFDLFTPAPENGITIDSETGFLNIMTPNGLMAAQKGAHYIVKLPSGKFRPLAREEFEGTYEEFETPEPPVETPPAPEPESGV